MPFVTNDLIEIEASQFRAVARVRNVMGARLHVAFEAGYVPWSDETILVRRYGDPAENTLEARIIHVSGSTAMLELREVLPTISGDGNGLRDTMTDES